LSTNIDSFSKTSSNNLDGNKVINHNSKYAESNNKQEEIIITEHLGQPCPGYYTDIFNKVLIVCKDPEHKLFGDKTPLNQTKKSIKKKPVKVNDLFSQNLNHKEIRKSSISSGE
jgi:hypothetical protein